MDKLSPNQKAEYKKRFKMLLFLKALSVNVYQDIRKLGERVGLLSYTTAQQHAQTMIAMIAESHKDRDFPRKILDYLNNLLPLNYPKREMVQFQAIDVVQLSELVKAYEEKLRGIAKEVDPDTIFGNNAQNTPKKGESIKTTIHTDKGSINNMSSNFGEFYQQQGGDPRRLMAQNPNIVNLGPELLPPGPGQEDQQQDMQPQMQPQQMQSPFPNINMPQPPQFNSMPFPNQDSPGKDLEQFTRRHPDNVDVAIMEWALYNINNQRPNLIPSFISAFKEMYDRWVTNTGTLTEQLRYYFGAVAGEHAYKLWRERREAYRIRTNNSQMYPLDTLTYGTGMGMHGMGSNVSLPPEMIMEMEQEKRDEKKMRQMQNMMYWTFMNRAMEAQSPGMGGQMANGNYEEFYDGQGRVVKRVYLGPGQAGAGQMGGNGDMTNNPVVQGLQDMYKIMLQATADQNKVLLEKISTPDEYYKDVAKSFINSHLNNQNPVGFVQELVKAVDIIRPPQQSQDQTKNLEALKIEIESKLALAEIGMKQKEQEHNWKMDEKLSHEDNTNVDRWIGMIEKTVTDIGKPFITKLTEGLSKGTISLPGIPGIPGMGAPQGQAGPGQVRLNPEQLAMLQRAQAMREQQMYAGMGPQMQMGMGPQNPYMQQNPQFQGQRRFNQPPQHRPQQQQQQQQQQNIPFVPPYENVAGPQQQQNVNSSRMQQEQELENIDERLDNLSEQELQVLKDQLEVNEAMREKVLNKVTARLNNKRTMYSQNYNPQSTEQIREARNVMDFRNRNVNVDDTEADEEYEDEEEEEEEDEQFRPTTGERKTKSPVDKKNTINTYDEEDDFDTSTNIMNRGYVNPEQEALIASGQMSPNQVIYGDEDEDYEEEEDENDPRFIPIAAGYIDKTASLEKKKSKSPKRKVKAKPKVKHKVVRRQEPEEEYEDDEDDYDDNEIKVAAGPAVLEPVEEENKENPVDEVMEEVEDTLEEAKNIIPSDDEE